MLVPMFPLLQNALFIVEVEVRCNVAVEPMQIPGAEVRVRGMFLALNNPNASALPNP
jgi:hypothetical protein